MQNFLQLNCGKWSKLFYLKILCASEDIARLAINNEPIVIVVTTDVFFSFCFCTGLTSLTIPRRFAEGLSARWPPLHHNIMSVHISLSTHDFTRTTILRYNILPRTDYEYISSDSYFVLQEVRGWAASSSSSINASRIPWPPRPSPNCLAPPLRHGVGRKDKM